MNLISPSSRRFANASPLTLLAAGVAGFVWAYWTTLAEMAQRWAQDPMYSHGYLVPGFAVLLLWLRREKLAGGPLRPAWWGIPLLGASCALRLAGAHYYFVWLEAVSLVPFLAGLVGAVGGRRAWAWSWPAVAFLLFMVPLPYTLEVALTGPLQQAATVCSTFAMQTLALPALADGTVIMLNETKINIVEACSGLRMLVTFFALAAAVVLVIRRPLWQKLLLVASAVPIALVVNVLRITVTGLLFETVSSEAAMAVFHDLAGWLMMPAALALLAVELYVMDHLFIDPRPTNPRPAAAPGPRPRNRNRWQAGVHSVG